jgi:hypothetical protein
MPLRPERQPVYDALDAKAKAIAAAAQAAV